MVRSFIEQRVDEVVYQRIGHLFDAGYRQGALQTPPELLTVIVCAALEALLTSDLPPRLDRSAADLLRETVDVVLRGALASGNSTHTAARSSTSGSDTTQRRSE
ncbi:hypothetical protein A5784_16995 [Mycobacterium sp. 852013-50091_SCH5140682]|uniref:hypothetical protein n=1 Tax=Mycobacterium sp. 852013-50091_SCH5140682 TaxID=1834109 RepID=UPI0007E9D85E|nr:hypothetical protein [Mycobacterium sp. 852013-50091_SCH5140682]OBC01803.1 hypothetical protein A5784_16995 [Mycobacterium sp. 852013-50091_SCH5140682]